MRKYWVLMLCAVFMVVCLAGCSKKKTVLDEKLFRDVMSDGYMITDIPGSESTKGLEKALAAYCVSENTDADESRPSSFAKDADAEKCQTEFYQFSDDDRCSEVYNHLRIKMQESYQDDGGYVFSDEKTRDSGFLMFTVVTDEWRFVVCKKGPVLVNISGTSSDTSLATANDILEKFGI